MLEWIWLHMAINAAVVSVAGKYGNINQPSASAENLMNSSAILKQAVVAIRETSGIIAARGVILKYYRNELLAYWLPTLISVPLMKKNVCQECFNTQNNDTTWKHRGFIICL